jgi:hypothetical protein
LKYADIKASPRQLLDLTRNVWPATVPLVVKLISWRELLPHFKQEMLFDDDFSRNPIPFNGRRVGLYKWYTTGVGYQTAVVRSGYATAAGNAIL